MQKQHHRSARGPERREYAAFTDLGEEKVRSTASAHQQDKHSAEEESKSREGGVSGDSGKKTRPNLKSDKLSQDLDVVTSKILQKVKAKKVQSTSDVASQIVQKVEAKKAQSKMPQSYFDASQSKYSSQYTSKLQSYFASNILLKVAAKKARAESDAASKVRQELAAKKAHSKMHQKVHAKRMHSKESTIAYPSFFERRSRDQESRSQGEASPSSESDYKITESEARSDPGYRGIPDALLEKMVVPTQWFCDLLPRGSSRRPTCGLSFAQTGLHPAKMNVPGNQTYDHMNSVRMLFPLGVVPCCSTMPFCSAPACSASHSALLQQGDQRCTKRTAVENLGFMTNPTMWPAYHGWEGSYELDVHKHWDVLHSLLREDGRIEPFDFVIDIGSDNGYVTEKLTTRKFARNYVMIDAFEGMRRSFYARLGNDLFRLVWLEEQVPKVRGSQDPEFAFLNVAVGSRSGGQLDMCADSDKADLYSKQWSEEIAQQCPVQMVALDDVLPSRLDPEIQLSWNEAQSAYIKLDVEGMDEMALRGMSRILSAGRGFYDHGEKKSKHFVNFIQLKYDAKKMSDVKQSQNLPQYDLQTLVSYLESMGFETLLVGPWYLPLSHGSWSDEFKLIMEDPEADFAGAYFPTSYVHRWRQERSDQSSTTVDLVAIRASHPKAGQIKRALGACQESKKFKPEDPQYDLNKFK
jgi:hypothetical protein